MSYLRSCGDPNFSYVISRQNGPTFITSLGTLHGINKEVILVAREGTTLHFDIKDYNVIFYKSYSELESRVAKRMAKSIAGRQEVAGDPAG